MKKLFVVAACVTSLLTTRVVAQNLLSGKYTVEELKQRLIPRADWKPFPALNDRAGWAKADPELMKSYIAKAESYLHYQWPSIPATKSLLIVRTGDREEYQDISFEKRRVLGSLIMGEIAENKGRFIDPIIDGVWSICEESFWGVPAHIPPTHEYGGLMDVSQPFVELFVSETATYLAWVDYFFAEKLDAVSPQIRKRIVMEINTRVIEPLKNKPHGWMRAGSNGRPPNNWNPWICSNWLNTVLLMERDQNQRAEEVHHILDVLDQFLNPYPQDGGCDEGPSYWGAAGASLYDNVSLLCLASNDAFRYVYQDEKIRNMGKFIYRAQISERYFLDFADADPWPGLAGTMIYRYGKDIGDADMMKLGAYYPEPHGQTPTFHFFRGLFGAFLEREYRNAPKALPLPKDVWLPDLQVMAARDEGASVKGFYLAAKGGHNDESHNHNDVGSFVVYYDGLPLLIDVGRGTYTMKTFSARRYEIWYNCSDYHNLPTINGKTQPPGASFRAGSVKYEQDKNAVKFSLELAKAYPADAGVKSLIRTVTLNRGKNVVIEDRFQLAKAGELTEYLMTIFPVDIGTPGELVIHYKGVGEKTHDFIVRYDKNQFRPDVEKVVLDDPEDKGVIEHWGDSVYRISLKGIHPTVKDRIRLEVISSR